ncbi:lipocalin family protein [Tenacibaculum maritimum]|nr:lipocalin family protein [Tenacibaculum maritimum]MDB0600281.1 lipocalin family protein [Tenacibaculum maritimum]MDB0602123.1 lipocalin family protein [Tenacibaculum maritimum]MDB0610791.1 lipocalin family protein [Tenacibaculum maritimum]
MKRIITLITIITITLTSCSSDDEVANFEGSQSDLIGNWILTGEEIDGNVIPFNQCLETTNVKVDSNGGAVWTTYSKDSNDECQTNIDNFVFKANNVNFTIEDNSQFNNYYGKFYSSNDIEITKFFDDNNGLKSKTVYRFNK